MAIYPKFNFGFRVKRRRLLVGEAGRPFGVGLAGDLDGMILDGRGWIERIEEDLVVIADVLRPLSPYVTYHSGINGLEASASEFRPGTFVGYRLNSEREIIALWLLEEDGS